MKILCVEDDVDIATLMDNILTASSHNVTTCHNGVEALSLIRKERFNLIFLDMKMPDFSGLEVINSLYEEDLLEKNNIVILTAKDIDEQKTLELKKKGIKDSFQKPLSLEKLLEIIKKFE